MDVSKSRFVLKFALQVAARYRSLPQVEAVAIAGSQIYGVADQHSDIDLYVYSNKKLPINDRRNIAKIKAESIEVNNLFWEPTDTWLDREAGIIVEVMFREINWIEEQLQKILVHYNASVGYSTCFWHNILHSQALYDKNKWFKNLQKAAKQTYPEKLKEAIVAKNFPILYKNTSSYIHQLEDAIDRGDNVSVNHRVAAFLASYFDIIFALNYLPHPGEKRLLKIIKEKCTNVPNKMDQHVKELLSSAAQGNQQIVNSAKKLIDGLDLLLDTNQFKN